MSWVYYAISAMLLQGFVIFLVKLLSSGNNPLLILFFQYTGSLAVVFFYLKYKKVKFKLNKKELKKVLLSGFLVSTGLSFYYLAIGLADASKVVPIQSVGVSLIPAVFAFAVLKEKITKRLILGLVFSVLCILFLTV